MITLEELEDAYNKVKDEVDPENLDRFTVELPTPEEIKRGTWVEDYTRDKLDAGKRPNKNLK